MAGAIQEIRESKDNTKVLVIIFPCVVCNKSSEVELDREQYEQWQSGMHVQAAFPEMSAEDREILISGTHPECWDILWAEE